VFDDEWNILIVELAKLTGNFCALVNRFASILVGELEMSQLVEFFKVFVLWSFLLQIL
jgi:hypothetical protein